MLPESGEDPETFPVLRRNWTTVHAFLAVQTQWRTDMNGLVGLDYGAVEQLARLTERNLSRRRKRQILDGLRIMEAEVLKAARVNV